MYILSCGGWYVGNTAILEWLNNFTENYYLKGDFHELRVDGGLYDSIYVSDLVVKKKYVKNQIVHHSKGILRSILNSLNIRSGKGHGYDFKYNFYMNILLFNYYLKINSNKTRKLGWEVLYWDEGFRKLKDKLDANAENLVLQNPIYYDDISPKHANIWRSIFVDSRLFFVTRDPVDQFIDIYIKGEFEYGATKFRAGTEGLNPVETFFKITKRTYLSRIEMLSEYKVSELAVISFEKFASMTPRLEREMKLFFGVSSLPDKTFDFSYTKSNTNLKVLYPEVYKLIKPYSKELEELYDLKSQLDDSEYALSVI